jgi:hypothetical protein
MTGDPSLPIGGTAGLGHTRSGAVDNAAAWLAVLPDAERPRPLVPGLKSRFGLSSLEAIAAIRESHLIKGFAHGEQI